MIKRIISIAQYAIDENPRQALFDARWYQRSGDWCFCQDADFDLPAGTTAAFMAALSPLNTWEDQLRFTPPSIAAGLQLIRAGHSAISGIVGPGFGANRDKAARILAGENPDEVLSGDKVTAFYRNLTGDLSVVTIDRHALAIAGWEKSLTSNAYRRLSFAFRMAGEYFELEGAEIQALTWNHWRRTHAAKADSNIRKGR